MSVKAFYFEENAIKSVLQLPDKIFVIPGGISNEETKTNCKLLVDKLRYAGFNYKVESQSLNGSNDKLSIAVQTGNSSNVARTVLNILGVNELLNSTTVH